MQNSLIILIISDAPAIVKNRTSSVQYWPYFHDIVQFLCQNHNHSDMQINYKHRHVILNLSHD